jgi:hypothetical protein
MSVMNARSRYIVPTRPTGYPIDQGYKDGWFGVLVPGLATNLDPNPSFELGTTGATAVNCTLALSSDYQRRGLYSMKVTPTSLNQDCGYRRTITTIANTPYCFAIDLYDPACRTFELVTYDNGLNRVSRTYRFQAKGYWQRVWVNWAEGASGGTRLLWVLLKGPNSNLEPYYVDGSLIQAKSKPDDYFDGDSMGYLAGQTAYFWNGARHASTSTRILDTGSGGEEVRLSDLGLTLLGVVGLGLGQFANVATPLSTGGAYYQSSIPQTNQFGIVGELAGDPEEVERQKDALTQVLKPKRIPTDQPMTLVYHRVNERTGEETERLLIPAVYESGLEGGTADLYGQRLALSFRQYIPSIYADGDQGVVLGFQGQVTDFANIGYRDVDGQWRAMDTGFPGAVVRDIILGPDGCIYAAVGSSVQKWDGASWTQLGGVAVGGSVYTLAFGSDGILYAGGSFTDLDGGAYIAQWDGSNWSGLLLGANGAVYALTPAPDGYLYVGGAFTSVDGGLANTSKIARWDGSNWSEVVAGANDTVYALASGPDGVFAGGAFTSIGGVAINRIAKWDGTTWSAIGAITGVGNTVKVIARGPDASLYIGGDFSVVSGVTVHNIARWNGVSWSALGGGVSHAVETIVASSDGSVYAGGLFTRANYGTPGLGIALPDRGAKWSNGEWTPIDVNVEDASATFYAMEIDNAGRLYIGGSWSGTTALSATVTASNVAGGKAYPVVTFTGPGNLWQIKNYTTGQAVYFNNLTLLAGETATLYTDPLAGAQFVSDFRGNLSGYISDASTDFYLMGGDNNVSAYMTDTDSDSAVTMTWRPVYDSLASATR